MSILATSLRNERPMVHSVEATYENGLLRLAQPLPLKEREKVHVVVYAGPSRVRETAGMMGWTGSAELAERFAMDPELDGGEYSKGA
jgi:predicted DNA-binding antitoxin AbrB/MazE fold protein